MGRRPSSQGSDVTLFDWGRDTTRRGEGRVWRGLFLGPGGLGAHGRGKELQ